MLFLAASPVIVGRGFLAGWEEFGRSSSPCLPVPERVPGWLEVPLVSLGGSFLGARRAVRRAAGRASV